MNRMSLLLATWLLLNVGSLARGEDPPAWPQWRGPLGTGEAPGDPPVEWSETKNVRWKARLTGLGHSTPVIWGDAIFVTSAEPFGPKMDPQPETAPGAHDNLPVTQRQQFFVAAISRRTGKNLWRRRVHQQLPHEGGHTSGSLASASPVCDAEHVIACFGSYGLYCFNHAGQPVWEKQLGEMQTKHGHGEGASPALSGDTLVVNWDHEGGSFIVALDKSTGREKWRSKRTEVTSWASPIIIDNQGRKQVVVCGTNRIRGYDLETGKTVWQCGGLSNNVVASPVYADGMLYAGSSYDTRTMMGIRVAGAEGELTGTDRVVWRRRQRPPYVPSPLLYQGALYYLRHYQGILTRLEAKTGEEPAGPYRLDRMFEIYASPIAAAGRVYVTDRDGLTLVMQAGQIARFLASNQLDDRFSASAAVVEDELFLRGEKWLYCISRQPPGDKSDGQRP